MSNNTLFLLPGCCAYFRIVTICMECRASYPNSFFEGNFQHYLVQHD